MGISCSSSYGRGTLKRESVFTLIAFVFPVGRLVWAEKDPEAETRAQREGICTPADRNQKDGAEKSQSFLGFKKKKKKKKKVNGKNMKRKRSGAKIFALSPPCVWHVICLYVFFFFFFFLLKWLQRWEWEYICKNHWKMCKIPHSPRGFLFAVVIHFVLA